VSADDEFSLQEGDEDLSEVLQAVQEQAEDAHILVRTLWQIDKTACNLAGIVGLKNTHHHLFELWDILWKRLHFLEISETKRVMMEKDPLNYLCAIFL